MTRLKFMKFNHPELGDPRYQEAFQMLVAGVGFYQPGVTVYNGWAPYLGFRRIKPHYAVYSHAGEYIGCIPYGVVCNLIHKLRRPQRRNGFKSRAINYQIPDPNWSRDFQKIVGITNLTYGFDFELGVFVNLLMEKFERLPPVFFAEEPLMSKKERKHG